MFPLTCDWSRKQRRREQSGSPARRARPAVSTQTDQTGSAAGSGSRASRKGDAAGW